MSAMLSSISLIFVCHLMAQLATDASVAPPRGQICINISDATWQPNLQLMQRAPSGGQICDECKCRLLVVTNALQCLMLMPPGDDHYLQKIARGTTDPEIDSVTWIKFSNYITPLALVANLATRWRHLR